MSTEDFYDDTTGELHMSVTTEGLNPGECIAFVFCHDDGGIENFTLNAEEAIRLSGLADEAYDRAITEAHATTVTIDLPGDIVEAMLDGELAESDLNAILGLISAQINDEPCSGTELFDPFTASLDEALATIAATIAAIELPPVGDLFNGIIPGLGDLLDRLADADEALEDKDE